MRLRVRRTTRVRLALVLRRGRSRASIARSRIVRVRRGSQTVVMRLTAQGWTSIAACSPGRIGATVSRGRAARRVTAPLKPEPPRCSRFFGAASFWNSPLSHSAPLDPDSPAITGDLLRQIEKNYRSGQIPTINTSAYSAPVYTVPSWQPNVRVHLDQAPGLDPALQNAFANVPIPTDARPAAGTDAWMVVWQPATNRLWEFWQARLGPDGWHARWGGALPGVIAGSGRFEVPNAGWGATATSLPLAGGLITPEELRRGRIEHALAMAIPEPRSGAFAFPAQRTDGFSTHPDAVPEGARFRLDPAIDLDGLDLPRTVRIIAEAAQRYGIIVRDRGGSVAFYAQDPVNMPSNPYPALFGPAGAGEMLRSFPWWGLRLTRMQLVGSAAPPLAPCLILCG